MKQKVELFAATRRPDFKALTETYWRVRPMVREKRPCDGWTRKGPCSFRARYRYRGVDVNLSGAYCWRHLVYAGIYGNPGDGYAFEKWAMKR